MYSLSAALMSGMKFLKGFNEAVKGRRTRRGCLYPKREKVDTKSPKLLNIEELQKNGRATFGMDPLGDIPHSKGTVMRRKESHSPAAPERV